MDLPPFGEENRRISNKEPQNDEGRRTWIVQPSLHRSEFLVRYSAVQVSWLRAVPLGLALAHGLAFRPSSATTWQHYVSPGQQPGLRSARVSQKPQRGGPILARCGYVVTSHSRRAVRTAPLGNAVKYFSQGKIGVSVFRPT